MTAVDSCCCFHDDVDDVPAQISRFLLRLPNEAGAEAAAQTAWPWALENCPVEARMKAVVVLVAVVVVVLVVIAAPVVAAAGTLEGAPPDGPFFC